MRICVISHSFSPAIGGVEAVASTLCAGFTDYGHDVTLITRTPDDSGGDIGRPYRVIRNPAAPQLVRAIATCDVVLHNNPVARWLWPSILTGRRTVIVHHTWLDQGGVCSATGIKRRLLARFHNAAVSDVLARDLKDLGRVTVLRNSFDDAVFTSTGRTESKDFAFVGRLVDDKGCELLINAWAEAAPYLDGRSLRIIGDGPELLRMQDRVRALDAPGVTFLGPLSPDVVAQQLRGCGTLVAPSRWREPFGLVALEAAASGCLVVAPADTGLVEAAGPALIPFQRNDVKSLTAALRRALTQPRIDPTILRAHLSQHLPSRQIGDYLDFLQNAARPL